MNATLLNIPPLRSNDADERERSEYKLRRVWTVATLKQQKRDARRAKLHPELRDAELLELRAEIEATRPKTRGDCDNVTRPCHFLSCKFNLALEVTSSGSIRSLTPEEFVELETSCALDVAERGGITLEEVGSLLGATRERVRQIEAAGSAKLREQHEREVK